MVVRTQLRPGMSRTGRAALAAVVGVVLVAAGLSLLWARYDVYRVPTTVMEDGLARGQVTLADTARPDAVHRADIVLFDGSGWPDEPAGAMCCGSSAWPETMSRAVTPRAG
jgi:hypothetical protein